MSATPAPTAAPTAAQRAAVTARGNVLVMAGAGTGKTKTLVDRCLHCLENDGAQIDELLIVTFTEAAAAEMRARLRRALEARAAADPAATYWPEQLARFELAHIGTLHSFCLKLVREHFYELGLDPQLGLLDEGESRQLAEEILEEQFLAHYEDRHAISAAVRQLLETHSAGRDDLLRRLILRVHHYSQAQPNATRWLAGQRAQFASERPAQWQTWLAAGLAEWCAEWRPVVTGLAGENPKAAQLANILERLTPGASRELAAEVLDQVVTANLEWPKGKKGLLEKPLKKIFEEAAFLLSLTAVKNGVDPLAEDWSWVRGQLDTLLQLAEEFARKLADRKRTEGSLDFHDLEQFALKLLWNEADQPSAVAAAWRAQLKFVFVDEYQDINAVQDRIIQGLSRDEAWSGAEPARNRFLVGDVKQSIYRFRLADPRIFRAYAETWQGGAGQTIALSENFRSRDALLHFVNEVCRLVLRAEIGGVGYEAAAELKFGAPEARMAFSVASRPGPRAELLLRRSTGRTGGNEEENDALAGAGDAEREARMVAGRLQQIMAAGTEIFDDELKEFRPVKWRDMAILLRATRGKSEVFAKEFERAGIPLAVARGGFYESAEILDLLSLLQLLDNPLQDVPCIAVLRSPLGGLTLDELAIIRTTARDKHFWTALNRVRTAGDSLPAALGDKVARFLERFLRWRRAAKLISLSQCLESILAETHYTGWLQAQPRGAQRAANVAGFLQLAQAFDQFQRQGLFRFLKFIAAEQAAEVEPEVAATATENAVRLMSIHQSKGLEFPVVVLADLAKRFNQQDLSGEIIFDEAYGLCPKIKPPTAGGRYPSLPHWLAQRRQRRELRGEELRLLYVALTRARDHLLLTASISDKQWAETWNQAQEATVARIAAANSFSDWLALWFSRQTFQPQAGREGGSGEWLQWQLVPDENQLSPATEPPSNTPAPVAAPVTATVTPPVLNWLDWTYPAQAATRRKAKASVTALRREAAELEAEAEAETLAPAPPPRWQRPKGKGRPQPALSPAEIGAAHHTFFQHVALDKLADLAAEADRLTAAGHLSAAERAALDLPALAAFWDSDLGRQIAAQPAAVRRELQFTARFRPAEITACIGGSSEPGLADEWVVVQGVADLLVLQPGEIWLVDFKTDHLRKKGDLEDKVKTYTPQLQLYAAALERIYTRPVTLQALHFLHGHRTVKLGDRQPTATRP